MTVPEVVQQQRAAAAAAQPARAVCRWNSLYPYSSMHRRCIEDRAGNEMDLLRICSCSRWGNITGAEAGRAAARTSFEPILAAPTQIVQLSRAVWLQVIAAACIKATPAMLVLARAFWEIEGVCECLGCESQLLARSLLLIKNAPFVVPLPFPSRCVCDGKCGFSHNDMPNSTTRRLIGPCRLLRWHCRVCNWLLKGTNAQIGCSKGLRQPMWCQKRPRSL